MSAVWCRKPHLHHCSFPSHLAEWEVASERHEPGDKKHEGTSFTLLSITQRDTKVTCSNRSLLEIDAHIHSGDGQQQQS